MPKSRSNDYFSPLSSREVQTILGLTIKRDGDNKLLTFLCMLSAYTWNSQFNLSFNAPSSSGKSYIPIEIAKLFPAEDVREVGYCSPTAFFHDEGIYDKTRGGYIVDLENKILIFLDQPHTLLLEHLRPVLSHDKKEIHLKITDKSQKGGLRTKNIYLRGFPAVIFCSTGLKIDEQESTRFMMLSPETDQEKLRASIVEKIKMRSDEKSYQAWLESNPERKGLQERVRAIKQANVKEIVIQRPEFIQEMFFREHQLLKPRHQRDIDRIFGIIRSLALLNLWDRNLAGNRIVANGEDISEAFHIWAGISQSQELNLPPYVYDFFKNVILPAWTERNPATGGMETEPTSNIGLSRKDLTQKSIQVYHRPVPDWMLRQQILPMLESVGLIVQEPDPNDRRRILVYPTTQLTISQRPENSE